MEDSSLVEEAAVNWIGLAALAVIVLVFVAIFFATQRGGRSNIKALAALGGRRGWEITRHLASLGTGTTIDVRPGDGSGWSCRVSRYTQSDIGTSVLTTEFTAPRARLRAGMVVVGPALPGAAGKQAEALLGGMGGAIEGMLLKTLLGADAAGHAPNLRLLRDGVPPGITAFATPDAPAAEVLRAFARSSESWRVSHRKDEDFPILIATASAFRLRLRTDATQPAKLEAFVDLALEISGNPVFA